MLVERALAAMWARCGLPIVATPHKYDAVELVVGILCGLIFGVLGTVALMGPR